MASIRANPVYQAMARVLDDEGIKHDYEHRGKHAHLIFNHANQHHSVIFSLSASDWRAGRRAKSYIRRLLRGDLLTNNN